MKKLHQFRKYIFLFAQKYRIFLPTKQVVSGLSLDVNVNLVEGISNNVFLERIFVTIE